jgi:hypothetical protein
MLDKKPSHRVGTIITVVLSAAIFVIAGWLCLNRQYAMDQVSVWAYQAPVEVQAIEERLELADKGRFYFYASHPEIADAESFNANCPRREIGSPILGCYGMGRMYIYDITNPKLAGIEEVTAAHEMLHAAWDRLSSDEQKRVSDLLEEVYADLAAGELKERMDYYARTEPGQLYNELHSIIGTEVTDIGEGLEAYYKQYFEDRTVILGFHAQYNSVFKSLQSQAETLYNELSELGVSITTRTTQYNADSAQLSNDIEDFNARANSNGFESLDQFYQERAALVARSNQLLNERDAINADISLYNSKYEQYQSVAIQIESLNKSIDSIEALDPSPTLQG